MSRPSTGDVTPTGNLIDFSTRVSKKRTRCIDADRYDDQRQKQNKKVYEEYRHIIYVFELIVTFLPVTYFFTLNLYSRYARYLIMYMHSFFIHCFYFLLFVEFGNLSLYHVRLYASIRFIRLAAEEASNSFTPFSWRNRVLAA